MASQCERAAVRQAAVAILLTVPPKLAISENLYFCLVLVAFLTVRFYFAYHYSSGTWDYFYKSNRDSSSHT